MVHGQQVVFPLRIDHLQHDHALVGAHALLTPHFFAFGVVLARDALQLFGELVQTLRIEAQVVRAKIDAEAAPEFGAQAILVPLLGLLLLRTEGADQPVHDAVDGIENLLLLVLPLEQLAPQAVDGLALLVHHVVVLEQVFAGLEVLGFNGPLGGFDALGDEAGLDGNALFHSQLVHDLRDALAGEDAQQVILERQVEAGRTGIALTAGAAAQLVVDAAGLMALRPQDVQAA